MTVAPWLSLQWQLIRPYGRLLYYAIFPSRRPDYFQKSWTYPGGRLGLDSLDAPEAADFACIFLPMNDWHVRLQRSQQLDRKSVV